MRITDFGLKFIDIMIGIVLGLGFQWWPELFMPWQYFAFLFVYVDIIDYWVDYAPYLRKFPPKKEIDIIIDVVIMFNLFLYIYSALKPSASYFFISFMLLRALDIVWIGRALREYPSEKKLLKKWVLFNTTELCASGIALLAALANSNISMQLLIATAAFWGVMRIYKAIHFKNMGPLALV